MNIWIHSVKHESQRYPTCGDWLTHAGRLEEIRVSRMDNPDHEFLVGIHELVEAYLCQKRGITDQQVTEFDKKFETARKTGAHFYGFYIGDAEEPGDHPNSPYRNEHKFATAIEKMLADEIGVDWEEYEKAIYNL